MTNQEIRQSFRSANATAENADKPYSLSLWESHPYDDNDDCDSGLDFATLAEAEAVLADPWAHFSAEYFATGTKFFVLDGPDLPDLVVTRNPLYEKPSRRDDGEWRREIATQAGMAFGCDGYNDEMDY